jgi:hypothetical protein
VKNVVLELILFLSPSVYHIVNPILQQPFGDVAGKRSLLNSGLLVQGVSMVSFEYFVSWFHIYRGGTCVWKSNFCFCS